MSDSAHKPAPEEARRGSLVLLASIFIVASCGLGYELIAGTLSSYLLGNSVTQFSIVIGLFLTAMGVGSFASKYVRKNLVGAFLLIETLVGIIGGAAPLFLFFAFAALDSYQLFLILTCVLVGILVGFEIPLMVRILRNRFELRTALSHVISLDYIGALAASLIFPLVMAPHLGLIRSSALFGMLNILVALVGLYVLRSSVRQFRPLVVLATASMIALVAIFVTAGRTTSWLEDMLYQDDIVYAESTPYQRIVLTRWRQDVRLFLNGSIQFSTVDEFRYHESLVHPAMASVDRPQRVLILGGGDGMAAREVLKYDSVTRIDLVDLDPAITRMFREIELLRELNRGSLSDARVHVQNIDAHKYLESSGDTWDVIIVDLPDPNDVSLGKLYTRSFYRLLAKHLTPVGIFVTQSTSPFYATSAFWCIHNTIAASELTPGGGKLFARPYHASVPSFGDWGFVLGSVRTRTQPHSARLPTTTQFLTPDVLASLFIFSKDIAWRTTPINRLDNQVLVDLYDSGFATYNR